MLDTAVRRRLGPVLDVLGGWLARRGVRPGLLTAGGLALALAAAVAAAVGRFPQALVLWLVSRALDGLDGPVARAAGTASDAGGWLDLSADVVAYAAVVVGAVLGQPDARVAGLVLLAAYYVNGSLFLLQALAVERRGRERPDARSLPFTRGLAEGTETIVAQSAMLAFPSLMAPIAWAFAALVTATAVQRALATHRLLR